MGTDVELLDEDQAARIPTWPHSGFHVHTTVRVPADDRAFAARLTRVARDFAPSHTCTTAIQSPIPPKSSCRETRLAA